MPRLNRYETVIIVNNLAVSVTTAGPNVLTCMPRYCDAVVVACDQRPSMPAFGIRVASMFDNNRPMSFTM